MPKALLARPEIDGHLLIAWDGFHDLSGDRAIGAGGFGRIPWTAIRSYATHCGFGSGDEFETFHQMIVALDGEWIRFHVENATRRTDSETPAPRRK